DEKVFSAIQIVIDEAGAEADVVETDGGNAGAAGRIYKLGSSTRIADVAVKRMDFVLIIGHKNGHSAAAIIIGGINSLATVSHPVVVLCCAGLHAYFLELHASLIEI